MTLDDGEDGKGNLTFNLPAKMGIGKHNFQSNGWGAEGLNLPLVKNTRISRATQQ